MPPLLLKTIKVKLDGLLHILLHLAPRFFGRSATGKIGRICRKTSV